MLTLIQRHIASVIALAVLALAVIGIWLFITHRGTDDQSHTSDGIPAASDIPSPADIPGTPPEIDAFYDRVWRYEAARLSNDRKTQELVYSDLASEEYQQDHIVSGATTDIPWIQPVDISMLETEDVRRISYEEIDGVRYVTALPSYTTLRNDEIVNYVRDGEPHTSHWKQIDGEWLVTAEG